jgi:uncharacterized protein YraI
VTVLCLLAPACGDDAVFEPTTTTTQPGTTAATSTIAVDSTSTTAPTTTTTTSTIPETTTTTWETYAVPAEDLCVIDHLSDDALNVRSGPGGTFGVIGTLPYDGTGVHATGQAADDAIGQTWKQIDHAGGLGWVAAWLLTTNACTLGAPAGYCVADPVCGLSRLDVRSGPGAMYEKMGSLPWTDWDIEGTGASTIGGGIAWQQIRFRGEVGWVPAANLKALPCAWMCAGVLTAPSAACTDGWTALTFSDLHLHEALELIGVGGVSSEIDLDAFVVEEARYFTGPEDANVVSPRPSVERWYVVGYAETDPSFRGRWLVRRSGTGVGLVAVAPHDSSGFGPGVWETCVDTCQTGRPLAGEWCNPACVEDYIFRSCEGIAPGAWSPGDCAGPPPEVLGCLEP